MTASFADDRFASLPISDLQGVISMHYHAKDETEVILHERQLCNGELARINRAIEQMSELSLPMMAGSSRTASAVRDARSQSVILQQQQQQQNNNVTVQYTGRFPAPHPE